MPRKDAKEKAEWIEARDKTILHIRVLIGAGIFCLALWIYFGVVFFQEVKGTSLSAIWVLYEAVLLFCVALCFSVAALFRHFQKTIEEKYIDKK
jgi:uncharacterized membrane protein